VHAGVRAAALGSLWCALAASAGAHDLITSEAAERYLAQVERSTAVMRSRDAPVKRAQASYELGCLVDEVRDLLNRDLAAHGRIQGLATEYLVSALQVRKLHLQVDPALGRYPAALSYYREALALAPDAPFSADAAFRLLQGYFYDSFADDPLQPREQSWSVLRQQIELGERLLHRHPQHPEREEAEFILAVHYVQAAQRGPDAATRAAYAGRARTAGAEFRARYPDSMRVAAVDVLLESLPGRGR
jgi:tetratricopeptide (TPR) repeat protein